MVLYYGGLKTAYALIAQLDRASGYGPEGREFESSSARQNRKPAIWRVFLYLCGVMNTSLYILMYIKNIGNKLSKNTRPISRRLRRS